MRDKSRHPYGRTALQPPSRERGREGERELHGRSSILFSANVEMRPLHVSRVGNFDPEDEIKLRAIERLANESPENTIYGKRQGRKEALALCLIPWSASYMYLSAAPAPLLLLVAAAEKKCWYTKKHVSQGRIIVVTRFQ